METPPEKAPSIRGKSKDPAALDAALRAESEPVARMVNKAALKLAALTAAPAGQSGWHFTIKVKNGLVVRFLASRVSPSGRRLQF